MASQPNRGGPAGLPFALIAQAIPKLSRHDLEAFAEALIDRLDAMDAPIEELEPEQDYCTAGDDRGSSDMWGTSGMSEDDEMTSQPPTLN